MKELQTAGFRGLLLSACFLAWVIPGFAATKFTPYGVPEIKHSVSAPLSEIVKTVPPPQFHGWIKRKEHGSLNKVTHIVPGPDRVAQDDTELPAAVPITIGLNFDGMNGVQAGGVIPPDTNGAVGDKQFVLITNFAYSVYDKTTGKQTLGPTLIHNIWNGFGGQCGTEDGGDPIVLFDKAANRWLVEQLEYFSSDQVCLAVSQTDDATGKYNLYAFTFTGLPDYPKLGIWPDGYYLAVNNFGNGFAEGQPCAFDRTAMLAGKTATMVCFNPSSTDAGFLPSDMDGATAPPSGAPNHYVELGNSNTTLKEYDFHVDFKVIKNSKFSGPNTITVPTYTQLCGGGNGACIPQPPGGSLLDALGDRLMFRNAYRNFGDHETLVFSHSVAPGKGSKATSAERWYELRSTSGGAYSVYQAATFQNKTNNLWMGSIAMDKVGNIALGYSLDNSTKLDPSIALTGRLPGDPLNKMEGPKRIVTGVAVQGGINRWGDYSNMSVDPVDDCTMWYIQEYGKNGGFNWQSRVVSFKFNSCQ